MKTLADSLSAIQALVSDADLILYTLNSLGPKYGPFITSLELRTEQPSFAELWVHLLTHEQRLLCLTGQSFDGTQSALIAGPTTHPAPHPAPFSLPTNAGLLPLPSPNNTSTNSNSVFPSPLQSFHNYSNSAPQSSAPNKGFNNGNGKQKAKCQICNRRGHVASRCYYRYSASRNSQPQAHFSGNQPHFAGLHFRSLAPNMYGPPSFHGTAPSQWSDESHDI